MINEESLRPLLDNNLDIIPKLMIERFYGEIIDGQLIEKMRTTLENLFPEATCGWEINTDSGIEVIPKFESEEQRTFFILKYGGGFNGNV